MHRISLVLAAWALMACSARVATDSAPGLVCRHAGGQCQLGGTTCQSLSEPSADDCNPDLETGGDFCCTDVVDAGAADAHAPAGTACGQATGHCILGGFTCASVAAQSAQDCNPDLNPGGAFCCLSADAGAH